jgi:hypothetical protein
MEWSTDNNKSRTHLLERHAFKIRAEQGSGLPGMVHHRWIQQKSVTVSR